MIYQEMYGYLTIEDPQVKKKVWPSLSPQTRDYINVFLTQISEAGDHFYYQKSKFFGLITEAEFENLCQVYVAIQSKDVVIDLAFEEEFKQAFKSYELQSQKKAAMKEKMNLWRAEMNPSITAEPTSVQENVFYNKRRKMVESDEIMENTIEFKPQTSPTEKNNSAVGCLIAIIAGILILITLYWGSR
jgi:hypothetical protein